MADNGALVTISGAALSLLLYENVRSTGDQMGLLLGNVLTFITKKVTDCDRQVEHVKKHINIDTVMVCSKDILQDGLGRFDSEKLGNLTKKKEKRVVGWFRFRRHNFLLPTMRDKIIHKEFASHFSKFTGASEEHFIMFLLNASTTTNSKSTHKYRHVCFQYKRGAFQPISLRINNLGDDAARHDGSDYKPVPEKKPEEPDAFTKLVEKLKLDTSTTSSVEVVTAIQKTADKYLTCIMNEVSRSDEEISRLQKQVNDLRARVQKSTWAKNIRQKEIMAEANCSSTESERGIMAIHAHGSPRSINSDDLFDSDQYSLSPNLPYSNSPSLIKNQNIERTKQSLISKDMPSYSSPEHSSCEILRTDSSPEINKNKIGVKESTPKFTNKGIFEDRSPISNRQTGSPKSVGRKSERHSFCEIGDQSHGETTTFGRKDQSPRPSSYTEQL